MPEEVIDQTDNWTSYYTNNVTRYMVLPHEIEIRTAIHTYTPVMENALKFHSNYRTQKNLKNGSIRY